MSDSNGSSSGSFTPRMALTVRDERTGKTYDVPITHNSIPATAFSRMVAPRAAIFGQEDREEDETAG
jgi:citrate synthase